MPAPRFPAGTRVAERYELERVIGEGGMGTVWVALDGASSERVALKLLRPELAEDPDATTRFEREAYAMSRIVHPAIVPLRDSGVDARGLPFLVYELVDGISLREHLSIRGRLGPVEAVAIALDVLAALGAAHEADVIHRDVKPSNVLLVRKPEGGHHARVIDFGIAKTLTGLEGVPRVTSTGEVVGTARYMSPEQAQGKGGVDHRTDVWSAAIVLYEMLSGRTPFEARSPTQTILKILSQEPALLSSVASGVPDTLVVAVHRGLAREPARRWPSATAFALALTSAIVASPADSRSTQPGHRDPLPDATATHTIRTGEPDGES